MRLEDCREYYYYHSGKASDVARQLGFAGLALIWIFKLQTQPGLAVPSSLILPAGLIVVTLACDLLQYISGTLAWGIYNRLKEVAGFSQDKEFKAPPQLNWPALVFFWAKLTAIIAAYVLLIRFLAIQFVG